MLELGVVIGGRYRIEQMIGRGGMGAVYQAEDTRLRNTIALKQFVINVAATDANLNMLKRAFEREACILARLHHQSLPKVIDYFANDEGQFLAMSFFPGFNMAQMLERRGGPLPVADVLRWADELLGVLDYLHRNEVIHRDIKPQNMKLSSEHHSVLLDFGLAKGAASAYTEVLSLSSIFGHTPGYAPLEQIELTGTDARSDLYSLAATLYHLLTDTKPTDAWDRDISVQDEQSDPLQPPHRLNPQVPQAVSDVLLHALALHADDRPPDAVTMRAALRTAAPQCVAMPNTAAPPTETLPDVDPALDTLVLGAESAEQAATVPSSAPRSDELPPTTRPVPDPLIIGPQPADSSATLHTLRGHEGNVNCLAFNPKGNLLASGGGGSVVRLWLTKTGEAVRTLPGHAGGVTCLAFSPDGSLLASGGGDGVVRVWDKHTRSLSGHDRGVTCLAFSPDGTLLASGGEDGVVRLWDVVSGAIVFILTSHEGFVSCLAFSPDGTLLASGGYGGEARLWDLASRKIVGTLLGPMREAVNSVAFSPVGNLLASGGGDGIVRLCDVTSGKQVHTLRSHTTWDYINSVAFSPDGCLLASGGMDSVVRLWDVTSGNQVSTLAQPTGGVWSVAFSPDGSMLASGSGDKIVRLWDVIEVLWTSQ